MNITWKYVKIWWKSGEYPFKSCQYHVYMFKYPLRREFFFLYSRDLNRYLNVFKRIFTIWADMSRYVYVNISQYFSRLYDRIWTDMHGMKRAVFFAHPCPYFTSSRCPCSSKEAWQCKQCVMHCLLLSISVHSRVYASISVHICVYQNSCQIWLSDLVSKGTESTPFQG